MRSEQAVQAELTAERDCLARSELDIQRGEDRLLEQTRRMQQFEADGIDSPEGRRFLTLLSEVLEQWRTHHGIIQDRVATLEGQLAAMHQVERATTPDEQRASSGLLDFSS